MKKNILISILVFAISINAGHAQDYDFLERMLDKANAQYQNGLDNVSGDYHYLRDIKLINKYNCTRLDNYKKKVDEYMHRSSVASLDYSQPGNVNSTCSVINAYLKDKYIKDEIDLLTGLYEEVTRLKVTDPENYTKSTRYNEIIAIFTSLENCAIQDIYKLKWQKLPTKQNETTNDNPQTAGDYYKQAQDKYKTKDYQAALQSINKSIEISPNYSGSYYFRASVNAFGLRNYDEAIKDYTKFIQMEPKNKKGYYYRGQCYSSLGKNVDAIKDFTETLNIDADDLHAYFSRALAKTQLSDRQGAMSDYDQIIKREAMADSQKILMATIYNNKGYCLVELGRYDQALPFINKAIELGPNESYIWGSRGELFYKTGKYTQSITDLDMAIELLESNASKAPNLDKELPYYYRGMAKIKIGKKTEGCADLSKAGELGKAEAYDEIKKYCK